MTDRVIYSRNWRAKVNGKGMAVIFPDPLNLYDVKVALIKRFCTQDVEVFR